MARAHEYLKRISILMTSLKTRVFEWSKNAYCARSRQWIFLTIGTWIGFFFGPCVFCAPLDRYVGQHIDRCSTDMSVDISIEMCRSTYWPTYQPRYRPSDGWHIDWLSADISVDIAADTRPICWPLIIGGISVDCRWSIGRLSYNISQKFRLSLSDV